MKIANINASGKVAYEATMIAFDSFSVIDRTDSRTSTSVLENKEDMDFTFSLIVACNSLLCFSTN